MLAATLPPVLPAPARAGPRAPGAVAARDRRPAQRARDGSACTRARRDRASRWPSLAEVGRLRADSTGRFHGLASTGLARGGLTLRARVSATGARSPSIRVIARDVTLAAVGDINLGDGVAPVMAARGLAWPWRSVRPTLRSADIAFGNLECSVSTRGRPVPKRYRFRGSPAALRIAHVFAGMDVLNVANNHAVDYGRTAFLDTLRLIRRNRMVAVGGGANLSLARRPHVVTRLGLRIAFVGFSDIQPVSFAAGAHRPGTSFASPRVIAAGVRAARRRSDVVVASFHWGTKASPTRNAPPRAFALAPLRGGGRARRPPPPRAGGGPAGRAAIAWSPYRWATSSGTPPDESPHGDGSGAGPSPRGGGGGAGRFRTGAAPPRRAGWGGRFSAFGLWSVNSAELAALDRSVLWHPFTQQRGWTEQEPPVFVERAEGSILHDTDGNAYIDGVSSLWCNVHGHGHPAIDAGGARPARARGPHDDARALASAGGRARRPAGRHRARRASRASSTPTTARPRPRSR